MVIYFLVIAMGCVLFALAMAGVYWLISSGQLDDLDTPALRMLHDDLAQEDHERG